MLDEFGVPKFSPEEIEHLMRLEKQRENEKRIAVDRLREPSPEPARVVSDITDGALKTSAARLSSLLASNPKIKAAQSEWEKKQSQAQSRPSSTGPSGMPSLKPPQPGHRKRGSPASDGSAGPAAKRQTNGFDFTQARQDAFRFTEEEVARQMAEINNTSSVKGQAAPRTQTHSHAMPLTGAEMVKKYTGQVTSQTPVPVPTPVRRYGIPMLEDYLHIGDVVPITIAEGTRPYSSYHDPEQGLISARGAIIPPNYKLHDDPERPFICPVRNCRRLFKGLQGLGGHFGAGHCSTTFNDNGDGTLTRLKNYKKNGPGPAPAVVVSRNPLHPDALPPVEPGLPVGAIIASREQLIKKTTRAQETPVQPPTPLLRSSSSTSDSNVKSFLHKHLSPDQTDYHREDIDFMLSLPRLRNLPGSWNQSHGGKTLDMNHYACALAYLTGRVVSGIDKCTASEGLPTARLSTPCIALPAGMPSSAKQAFSSLETCVGCRYWCTLQRRSNSCDWCPSVQRHQRGSGGSARSFSSKDATPAMDVDAEEEPEAPVVRTMTEIVHETKRSKRYSSTSTLDTPQPTAGILTRTGQMDEAELEMEDWEIAPGRMKNDSSSDNIAFSNSYLTSGQPVTVSEDVSFNVIVLKPGNSSHWKVEDDKLRTCSVASGKVVLAIDDQQTFNLGPNGVFVVRPGQACKVTNRLYMDSVLHCTTINDFALQ